MRKLLTALLLINIGLTAYSQSYETNFIETNVREVANPLEWQVYLSNEDFDVEYKFIACDPSSGLDFESAILKVTNKSGESLKLNWQILLHYGGTCRTCDYPVEYARSLDLSPGESIEGDCDVTTPIELRLFSRFTDPVYSKGAPLTAFKLGNLEATKY